MNVELGTITPSPSGELVPAWLIFPGDEYDRFFGAITDPDNGWFTHDGRITDIARWYIHLENGEDIYLTHAGIRDLFKWEGLNDRIA